jgi:hypothetical protein
MGLVGADVTPRPAPKQSGKTRIDGVLDAALSAAP